MKTALKRVEHYLRCVKYWRIRLADLEPGLIPSGLEDKVIVQGVASSATELLGTTRADVRRRIEVIDQVMTLLSEDEREFVKLRYESEYPWQVVADDMNLGIASAKRYRHKVLPKFAIAFGLEEEK